VTPSTTDFAARLTRAERRLVEQATERRGLLSMVRGVARSIRPADISAFLLDQAARWWTSPVWAVLTPDDRGPRALLHASRGVEAGQEPALRGIAEWVVTQGQDFATGRLSGDRRVGTTLDGSVLALGLRARERCVGVLVAYDPRPSGREPRLSAAAMAAVRVLLEPAAGALDKALLIESAEALSVTDDLTHLYNSRYLNQVLRRETKRAGRSGRPLSVLFIDLDGFKSINDTYGHLFGSRALVEAGAIIRGSARETDVAARFGGDEFALILPDTGAPGALAVAERVRERIAAHTFLSTAGLAVRLTASVGIATLPDSASSADELVQAADAAMYHVKDHGKNGIHASSR
jgi:diguanylate cyclase (GGDEF)-like protein